MVQRDGLFYADAPGCKVRQIEAGEKDAFNRFIGDSPFGNIYQTFEWGELKSHSGWIPLRLVLENDDGIQGAATVLKRSIAGMTMFYSPRGPVLDYGKPALLALFAGGIAELARRENAAFWRLDPELPAPVCPGAVKGAGLLPIAPSGPFGGIQPRCVWRIPLEGCVEKLWAALKKGGRRQVNRARRSGVSVRDGSAADLPVFYRLLQDTAEQDGYRIRRLDYFENLWNQLAPAHAVKLFLAFYRERPVSTALAVGFGRGVWDIYAGNSKKDRELGASYLLTWELLSWACREKYRFYDLGGIPSRAEEKDPLSGLRFFKSRFGGETVEFAGEFDLVINPVAHRLWHWGQKGVRLLRSKRKT